MDTTPGGPPLQFDTVMSQPQSAGDAVTAPGVTCASCRTPLTSEYYDVNGLTACGACARAVAGQAESPKGAGVLLRAAGAGLVAAILGAALYYAVIAVTHLEIGLVAIAIGYMVGYAIRIGTRGRGGRRFQVMALLLTYWSVGLAYTPLALTDMLRSDRNQEPVVASRPGPPAMPDPIDVRGPQAACWRSAARCWRSARRSR